MSLESHAEALKASLVKANLSPGSAVSIIPESFKPTTKLGVSFAGKDLDLGNWFRKGEVQGKPDITFQAEQGAPSSASYLLILTDPDAPTPDNPQFAFWRHWVLPGLQPLSEGTVVASTKPALTEYLGPGPKDE